VTAPSFLGVARDLMLDADAKAAYEADPDGYLAARGFDGLSPADVTDAVGFVAETLPPGPAAALSDPDGGDDALTLARLAQLDPTEVADMQPSPDTDVDADVTGLEEGFEDDLVDQEEPVDVDDEEDDDGDDDPLSAFVDPATDPSQLAGDGTDTGYEPFREDDVSTGLGVGYGNEDVDDVSPADHGAEPPDLGLHL
jgi:hypothetical protein